MSLAILPAAPDDGEAASKLAFDDPFGDYAGYARYGLDFAPAHQARAARAFLDRADAVALVARRGGALLGFAGAAPLEWDSRHFGVPMASLAFLVTAGGAAQRADLAGLLLAALDEELRGRGVQHLAARVSVADLGGLAALQQRGFRMVDTLVTYLGEAAPPRPSWVAQHFPDFESEAIAGADLPRFDRGQVAHFEPFMRESFRHDRFHADGRLPADRCDALYAAWFDKIFGGEWASGVQLIRKAGRVVGFCSFQEAHAIREHHGVRIIGRGLAAVLPEGRGGYALLAENICTRCPLGSRFQEFDTQIQNLPVINVWIRRGMPFFRARHSFHRWLADATP